MAFNLFNRKGKKSEPPTTPVQEEVARPEVETPSFAAPANVAILKRFYVSEKSARGQALNRYTFVVAQSATKSDVKQAVQRTYKVTVTDVNMVRLPSKQRIVGRWRGTKAGIKKAVVALKEGQTIAQASA